MICVNPNTSLRLRAYAAGWPGKLQNIAHTGEKDSPVVIDRGNMTDIARRIAFVLSQGFKQKAE